MNNNKNIKKVHFFWWDHALELFSTKRLYVFLVFFLWFLFYQENIQKKQTDKQSASTHF